MRAYSVLSLQRRLLKTVLAVVAYPKTTLLLCAALLVGSVCLALFKLQIDTDQDKLFSPQVPFFKTYLDFEQKFPENEALYVLIEPKDDKKAPDLSRWRAVADDAAAKLRALDSTIVTRVEDRVGMKELGAYAMLFASTDELKQSFDEARQQLVPLAAVWGQGSSSPMRRFLLSLSLTNPDKDKAQFLKILADSWRRTITTKTAQVPDLAELAANDPGDLGYTYVPDQTNPANHLLLIAVYLADDDNTVAAGAMQVDAVRQAAAAAAADFPDFHVAVTGRPALDADEMKTSDTDSTRAEIIALVVIFLGLVVFLRSVWMATVAEISLTVAIGWTFGWTTISVGELNILSIVFLITLIGIGMDYLVQILTRYRREAQRYERPAAVWARVFKHVSPPIFTACLGAAGAFFVSIFTDFRGAAELGVIAGGGLLLCLASGYTVLPALLVIFPPKIARLQPAERYAAPAQRASTARRLGPPLVWVVALGTIICFSHIPYFNPNLLDLQAQNLESVQLVHKLQTWSAVVMSPDLGMLRKVGDAIRKSPYVAGVSSLVDAQDNAAWLADHQKELPKINWTLPAAMTASDIAAINQSALALASQYEAAKFPDTADALRQFSASLSPAAQGPLSEWQEKFVAQLQSLLAQFSPPPLDVSKLPAELRNHYVSADGTTYALYIDPTKNLWQREPLKEFVIDVQARAGTVPGAPEVTGIAPEIYLSTYSIEHSFHKATAYALALVVLLVFLDLRSVPQTLLTISVLGLGLPMLVGLMGLLHVNWNFANFFGVPILIGAGHEYGVFMMHRYREVKHDRRRTWTAWDVSDRALLLCAFVTTSSFAFFWALGHHEGLKSLGLVMALGTACIYLAALLVLRPLLKWRIERAGHSSGKSGTTNEA
ncbi:MAG: MMPL family transporter [Tepidisphaeraceae bacterium]